MNRQGFYLVEVVLVITIITSFLLFIPTINNGSCKVKQRYFIYSLENDIQYGLTYSITHYSAVKLRVYSTSHEYKLYDGNLNLIKQTNFDHSIHLSNGLVEISHGYVISTVTITFTCQQDETNLTIYTKSGMVVLNE